jgi:hypothetical protein
VVPPESFSALWVEQSLWFPARLTQELEISFRSPAGKGTFSGRVYWKTADSLRLDITTELGLTVISLFCLGPEVVLVNSWEKKYYRGNYPQILFEQWLGFPLPPDETREALLGLLHLPFPVSPQLQHSNGHWLLQTRADTLSHTIYGTGQNLFPDSCRTRYSTAARAFTRVFRSPKPVEDCGLPLPGTVTWQWGTDSWLAINYAKRNFQPALSAKTFVVNIPEGYREYGPK